jgi:hypothetical protein
MIIAGSNSRLNSMPSSVPSPTPSSPTSNHGQRREDRGLVAHQRQEDRKEHQCRGHRDSQQHQQPSGEQVPGPQPDQAQPAQRG